jgi:hypothetical protein
MSTSDLHEKYYLTVDECPLKAWRKGNEGDFKHIRKDFKVGNDKNDAKAWEMLYNDYIQVIGLSQDFILYLELKKAKINALNDFIQSDLNGKRNRFLLNKINIIDAQIRELESKSCVGMTILDAFPIISKVNGFHLKEKDLTVLEYHNYLKTLK